MCRLCETNPVYEFTNKRKLCKTCFVRYFQKKFLYTLRKFNMVHTGDIIYYNQKTIYALILEDLFRLYSEKTRIKFTNNRDKATKIATDDSIDSEADEILDDLINKKIKNINPVDGKIIRPLYLFLNEEILLYAQLKGLKSKSEKRKKSNISEFLDDLEKKHPEVKRAVVNSYLILESGKN